MTTPETHIESDLEYAERVAKINMEGVDSMDTQEMLAEYGAVTLAENKLLDHYIWSTSHTVKAYKHLIQMINKKGLSLISFELDEIKSYLKDSNIPVTEQTAIAFLNAYIETAEQGIEIAKEERR